MTRVLTAVALLAVGCGGGGATAEVRQSAVVVSAAASLGDAFAELEDAFEASNPGVDVVLNLAGSSTLREQLLDGAAVDVFAPADGVDLDLVADAGLVVEQARTFARNRLAIAVPAGNPGGVTGLDDLADPGLFVGLCAEQVPCGRLARQLLRRAGVEPALDTEEPDVRALLGKVTSGDLDVAIVYRSDVDSGGAVSVPIPADLDIWFDYPIAVIANGPNRDGGREFVDFVLSEQARAILGAWGFSEP